MMTKRHEKVWLNCLQTIRQHVKTQSFKTWFEPIKPVQLRDNVLTIQVPNKFFFDWLEEHYLELLKVAVTKELGQKAQLEYQIFVENHRDIKGNTLEALKRKESLQKIESIVNPQQKSYAPIGGFPTNLNPNYTFDTFIGGSCNQLARNAGLSIAKNPGKTSFNPLILFGGVGLGKTHLAHAIGNETIKNFPEKRVLYTSTNLFTNHIIQALKKNAIYDLVNYYQLIDVLIVDDIQFLEGRGTTQEVFFNLFNNLHQLDKQIIITSDKPPKDLKGIQERLISRFKWGLSADLQIPDVDTRISILESKMNSKGIDLNHDIVEFISQNIRNSVRELEGVLVNLIAHSKLNDQEIDLALAGQVIRNFVDHINKEITVENIQKLVAEHFNISVDQLKIRSRKREVVVARQLSMYFAKEFTTQSLKSIGESFAKDHSTVLYSHKKVMDLMDTDKLFKDTVDQLKRKVELNLSLN
jgi:chromosomal replication initiator protein